MENMLLKIPYTFKKSYGGTPEPQTPYGRTSRMHIAYNKISCIQVCTTVSPLVVFFLGKVRDPKRLSEPKPRA